MWRKCSGGGFVVGGREMLVVDGEGGRHETLAVCGDAVEASSGDFGDESVASEFGDLAAGLGAAPFGFGVVSGWAGMEAVLQVFVAEPGDGVLAGQAGPVEGQVVAAD